jgi:hypothetical protein
MPAFSLTGPNGEGLPQVKMPNGTVRTATAYVNGNPYWGDLNAPTGFWNDIGRSIDNYWVNEVYNFTAPVAAGIPMQAVAANGLNAIGKAITTSPDVGQAALGTVSALGGIVSSSIHDWNNVPFGLHYLTRGISAVVDTALQVFQVPAQGFERAIGTVGNVITGHPLDESYQASKLLYSGWRNPGITDEYIRRYKAGENPFQLVAELQDPLKEGILQTVLDPFMIVTALGEVGKIGRFAKSLDTVADMYLVAGDSAKVLYSVANDADKVGALTRGVVTLDKEFQVARDGFTTMKTATSGSILQAGKSMVSEAMIGNVENISHDVLMAVARTEKDPETVMLVLRDTAIIASKDVSAVEKAQALARLADKSSSTVLLSKSGQQFGVLLADSLMTNGKFVGGKTDKLLALVKAVQEGAAPETLVKGTTDMLAPTLKRMFPSLAERITASDKIAETVSAGKIVPKELTRFLVNGEAEQISTGMRYLNKVGSTLDVVKNPINRVLATVYMGINPAYAMRNGLSNLVVMFIDDPLSLLKLGTSDAVFEKFGTPYQALHGLESAGVMGEKGIVAGKTTLLNFAARASSAIEAKCARAVIAHALEKAWGKLLPKVLRGADEMGKVPFKILADAGIAASDIDLVESLVHDGGSAAKAVEALMGNDYYAKLALSLTAEERSTLNQFKLYDDMTAAFKGAKNDPAKFQQAVEDLITQVKMTSKMNTEVVLSKDAAKARGGVEFVQDQQIKHQMVDEGVIGKGNDLYELQTTAKIEANMAYDKAVTAAQEEALNRATQIDMANGTRMGEMGPEAKRVSALNAQFKKQMDESYQVFSKGNKTNRATYDDAMKALKSQPFGSPEREAAYNTFKEQQHQLWLDLAERDFPINDQHLAELGVQDDKLIQIAQDKANTARLWNNADENWAKAGIYYTKRAKPLELSTQEMEAQTALFNLEAAQDTKPGMPNYMDEATVAENQRKVDAFYRTHANTSDKAKMFGPTRAQQTIVQNDVISTSLNDLTLHDKYPELVDAMKSRAASWQGDYGVTEAERQTAAGSYGSSRGGLPWYDDVVKMLGKEPSAVEMNRSLNSIAKGTDKKGSLTQILKQLILDDIYLPASQMDVSLFEGTPDYLAHQLMLADWTNDTNMKWRIIDQAQKIGADTEGFFEKFLEVSMTPNYLGDVKTQAAFQWFGSKGGDMAGAMEHGYVETAKSMFRRMIDGEAPKKLVPSEAQGVPAAVDELHRAPKTGFAPTTATTPVGGEAVTPPAEAAKAATAAPKIATTWMDQARNEGYIVLEQSDIQRLGLNNELKLNQWIRENGGTSPKVMVQTPQGWTQMTNFAEHGTTYGASKSVQAYKPEEMFPIKEQSVPTAPVDVTTQPIVGAASIKNTVSEKAGGIPLDAPGGEIVGATPSPSRVLANNADGLSAKIREIAAKQKWAPPTDTKLTSAQTKALIDWQTMVDQRMAGVRAQAYGVADAARKFTLLDYGDKYGSDLALSYLFPYQFWYNRTYRNFLTRVVDNPYIAASYARYKNTLASIHAGMPDWWRYNINSNELLGREDTNPLFFNLEATLNPLNGILGVDFTDPNRNTGWFANAVNEIGKSGPSVWTPITIAIGLAAYAQGNEAGGSAWIGRTIPATGTIKAATALAGIQGTGSVLTPAGLELDPAMILQGGMGTYDRRRVGRMLAQMYQSNLPGSQTQPMLVNGQPVTEAMAIDAASSQTGDVWNTAVRNSQIDPTVPLFTTRAMQTMTSSVLGVGAKGRTQSDMLIDQFYGEMNSLSSMRTQMSAAEYQKAWGVIREHYPFMDTLLLSRKSDDTRDGALSYNVLSRIPPGQATDYAKMVNLDSRLVDKFYSTKGDFTLWDSNDKNIFLAGIKNLGAVLDCPPTTLRHDWDQAKSNYSAMMDQADQIWGTGIQDAVTQYYSEKADPTNGSENANLFLQANPDVSAFLDWKAQVVLNDPVLNKYYGGIQFLEGWYRSQMYKQAAEKFGNDIFNINSLYFQIKDKGGDYAAYLRDTPIVKEYWAFLGTFKPQIAQALLDVGNSFPETPQGIVRADAKLTSLGSQDVFNGMQTLKSGLSTQNDAVVAAYSSGGMSNVTPSFAIGDYIATEGGKRWPDAPAKLDKFKALSASNPRAAAAYYQAPANADLVQYMKFDDQIRKQYNASQNQQFGTNQAYTTADWKGMLGDSLYRIIRADQVPDTIMTQLDQMAQQAGIGDANTLIQMVQGAKDWQAPSSAAEWKAVMPAGLATELKKKKPSAKAMAYLSQMAAQYGVSASAILHTVWPSVH